MRARRYRFLRLLVMGMLGLSLLLAWSWSPFFPQTPKASAHAFVIGSDPVDGTTIASVPSTVRIYFNEDIGSASRALVYVFTPGGPSNGREVDAGRSVIAPGNARELDTPLLSPSTLPQGSYEVRWSAIDNNDGHATQGLIGFNVGASVTGLSGTPTIGPSTSNILPQMNLQGVLAIMWEWLTLLALVFWIGLIVMEGLLVIGVAPSSHGLADNAVRLLRKQGRPLQWLCLSALLVGEVINLLLRAALLTTAQSGGGLDPANIGVIALHTNYGYLWMARIGLICIALVFMWWTGRALRGAQDSQSPDLARGHRRDNSFRRVRQQAREEQKASQESTTSTPLATQASSATSPTAPRAEEQKREATTAASAAARVTVALSSPDAPARPAPSLLRSTLKWWILAALIALSIAISGNTVQLAQAHISAAILNWLHLLAEAIWLGGVAYLGLVLLPLLPTIEPELHGELLVSLLRYYVPLLLAALGVLLISSLFKIETTIPQPGLLLDDPYGRALLVQLLLFALMLIFTVYSFFYVLPRLRRQVVLLPVVNAELPARRARRSALEQRVSSMKRAMHILSALGVGVLLCAALMSFYAPPIVFPPLPASITGKPSGATGGTTSMQTQTVGNLTISLTVLPGRVGAVNTVVVMLKDSGGNSVTGAHVQLRTNMQLMDMGTTTKSGQSQSNSATYVADFAPDEAFSMGGNWLIILTIRRPGHPDVHAQFVVTLAE
jgi:methionine-rich copper-binding protein CopC/putative copper export protein